MSQMDSLKESNSSGNLPKGLHLKFVTFYLFYVWKNKLVFGGLEISDDV